MAKRAARKVSAVFISLPPLLRFLMCAVAEGRVFCFLTRAQGCLFLFGDFELNRNEFCAGVRTITERYVS